MNVQKSPVIPTHGKDLRKGRFSQAGQVYLVTAVTRQRKPIFLDLTHGRALVQTLRAAETSGDARTLAFVVMPDHLHWLLELGPTKDLSTLVGRVKGRSARQISNREGVWQAGFHDHALRSEEDILATARYIVANPLRAGLVAKLADYPLWDAIWL